MLWRRLEFGLPSGWGILGKVRVHPLLVLLVLLAAGIGLWRDVVVLFILVTLHELGHATVAEWLGYEVDEVSLLPFGGVAQMSYGDIGFVPKHEVAIAIAGPLVNLLLIGLGAGLHFVSFWHHSFTVLTMRLNLSIVLFNLLPAMPLDGGRILRAAQSRTLGFESATREAYRLGIVLAGVLLVMGAVSLWAGFPHVGLLILASFLLYSAILGLRGMRVETVRFLDAKRRSPHRVDGVRAFAVAGDQTVRDVVKQFAPDTYHFVYVLDETGAIADEVEERELLDAVFQGNWLQRLDSLHNRHP